MQRQSLGSPSTKHLNEAHKKPNSSASSPSPNINKINIMFNGEEDELKKLKLKSNTTAPESYIHLIPMLTLLCILILFLSSHHPSQNDMAQFNTFNHLHNPADLGESKLELKGVVEIKKWGVLAAIRGLKNIKRDELKNRRLHRKIGNN